MARPKKEKPNRNDGRYEVKLTIGKTIDGTPIRKSFYSYISKEDAKKQADEYKIESEVANRTGAGFVDRNISFEEWAYKWLEVDVYKRQICITCRFIFYVFITIIYSCLTTFTPISNRFSA